MNSMTRRLPDVALLAAIVALTLTTAYIHFNLGGLLFLLNSLGYVGLAVILVMPVAVVQRLRPLVLFGLAGYTLATIVGWAIMGPYFTLAYITKVIEVVLLALIAVQLFRTRTEIVPTLRFARALAWEVARMALRRPAPAASATGNADLAGSGADTSET
jgi:hypothetical protein